MRGFSLVVSGRVHAADGRWMLLIERILGDCSVGEIVWNVCTELYTCVYVYLV